MEVSKLFEVLQLVGEVRSNQWKRVLEIVDLIQNDRVTILEKSWHEPYTNIQVKYYPLDLDKVDTWSTYDGECIDLTYYIEDNSLICDAVIYDGEMMHGYRRSKRFKAKICFDADYIIQIENIILYEFNRLAEREYENYLESQKLIWMTGFKNTILNNSVSYSKKTSFGTKVKLTFKLIVNYVKRKINKRIK